MWGYQRGFSFEDAAAESLGALAAGAFIVGAIMAAAALITVLIILCTEIAKVHLQVMKTSAARWLWRTDAAFGVVLMFGLFIAAVDLPVLTIYLVSWSFLLWVIFLEFLSLRHRESEPDIANLDSYVNFTPAVPATNGHAPVGAQ